MRVSNLLGKCEFYRVFTVSNALQAIIANLTFSLMGLTNNRDPRLLHRFGVPTTVFVLSPLIFAVITPDVLGCFENAH